MDKLDMADRGKYWEAQYEHKAVSTAAQHTVDKVMIGSLVIITIVTNVAWYFSTLN